MINYKNLKKEEQELINNFKDFLKNVLNFYEYSFKQFSSTETNEELFDDAIYQDKKNNNMCRDILDDCVWFIQKNEPRANHLRLIIAIINSLNDIRRISNYTVSMAKYYQRNIKNIDPKTLEIIEQIGLLTIDTSNQLYSLIDKFDLETIKKNALKLFDKYIEQYKILFYESIQTTLSCQNNAKLVATSVVVLKNFDRTIDHMMNIIENLISIN